MTFERSATSDEYFRRLSLGGFNLLAFHAFRSEPGTEIQAALIDEQLAIWPQASKAWKVSTFDYSDVRPGAWVLVVEIAWMEIPWERRWTELAGKSAASAMRAGAYAFWITDELGADPIPPDLLVERQSDRGDNSVMAFADGNLLWIQSQFDPQARSDWPTAFPNRF